VTLATAREVLRAARPRIPRGVITPEAIEEVVGGAFGVTSEELQSSSRARSVAFPRQICMYLARQLTNLSLQEVGRAFGGRDHSTVAHACDKIETERAGDPEFRSTLDSLAQQIRAGASRTA
ncbi:MAG: helix-turn-helix domain-containing protein, partial [Planctomycetota bacterium]